MHIYGSCWGFFFACLSSRYPRSYNPVQRLRHSTTLGLAELRLSVVSPFLDRQHGTARCIIEQLERLAVVSAFLESHNGRERCSIEQLERLAVRDDLEINVYAQRVEKLRGVTRDRNSSCSATILWHKV